MKTKKSIKIFCMTSLICAFVYGLILPFCWHNNPLSTTGTLSLLCENRKIFFWIWGILTAGSCCLNSEYMFSKYGGKRRYHDAFIIVAAVGMFLVAVTLGHSIAGWNPKRVIHWIGTGVYIAFLVASMLLYFIHNFKRGKIFKIFFGCVVGILALFLVMFLGFGKSGLMELLPNALIEVFLFFANFVVKAKND